MEQIKFFRLSGGILNNDAFETSVNSWLKEQNKGIEIVSRKTVTLGSDLYVILFYKTK